ncbi:MAG: VCBS repeat-containing protein [Betaproteobacteria bacterium]|nr:VCBS repeat-containing protein [Betaproteobacteria bacterium]MDH5222278.1 VCBS repeat-containing protein [Betaproteobacteria bacterium]MDH5351743.1 VCBS repeat-containing protein [Betaproteobacteria bacterium]
MKAILGTLAATLALGGAPAGAETITAARYTDPVERYGHFALGRPHEYARIAATTDQGRTLTYALPEDEVFEDLAPRIVQLSAPEPQELLVIVSNRGAGARLMLLGLRDGRLEPGAQSAAIGVPMRWLNPVGVADLDGDGRAEIAAVITPHVGGVLAVYRRQASRLVEIGSLSGFSNHAYRSPELSLSAPMRVAGRIRLLVPDTARRRLRIVGLEAEGLIEIGACPLPSPVIGPLEVVSAASVSIGLAGGEQVVAPADCLGTRYR